MNIRLHSALPIQCFEQLNKVLRTALPDTITRDAEGKLKV
jgi:hypothetical protein